MRLLIKTKTKMALCQVASIKIGSVTDDGVWLEAYTIDGRRLQIKATSVARAESMMECLLDDGVYHDDVLDYKFYVA